MKTHTMMKSLLGVAVVLAACGGTFPPPQELVNARAEVVRAKSGPAAQLDPADLHEADVALAKAEAAYADDPKSPVTADLAAIAALKAMAAEVTARSMEANATANQAQTNLQAVEADKLRAADSALKATQGSLTQTQEQLDRQRQETATERAQRLRVEAQLKDARDTLSRIASVKDDDRGMVVTFQGEMLFVTAKSQLLAPAMVKLDQVAETLRGQERKIDVVGYTDNQGGVGQANQELSERRAAAVRDYLVSKGIPSDLIRSEGRGATGFVADNSSIEGRAANRRVEIIIEPKAPAAQR
jgi:flagellar motor protein MotB